MWQRLLKWWRERVVGSHHVDCGGKWEETGTSGFAVLRLHFECAKCGEQMYILHSPE